MKIKKDWIKKLDDKSLDYFINKKEVINNVPRSLDKKINNIFTKTELKAEKEKIIQKFNFFNFNRLVFITSLFLIFLFSIFALFFFNNPDFFIKQKIPINNVSFKGTVNIIRNNSTFSLFDKKYILKNDYIKTEDNSTSEIKLGDNSRIIAYQNTLLKVLNIKKDKNNEINKLYIERGKIECNVTLSSNKSIFEILTDISLISIKGTHFFVEVLENKDVIVDVLEGQVEIRNLIKSSINLKNIKVKDEIIKNELNKLLNQKILIEKNNSILISKNELENYNKDLDKFLIEIKDKINKIENSQILKEIYDFKKINNMSKKEIIKSEIEKNKNTEEEEKNNNKKIIIKKIKINIGLSLNEKNTAITSDEKNIYISSDSNKAIICIDPKFEKTKWIFKHPDLDKITCAAISFKNKLILANPDNLFIININGNLDLLTEIKNGPIYWPELKRINNDLLIPTCNSIYKYNGETLSKLNNIPDILGQLYISSSQEKLFCLNLNEKNIMIYDLLNEQIIYSTNKINNRSFISPKLIGDFIYITDCISNIYRFNLKSQNANPEINNIGTGVISNLIFANNHLFFIANDGYFYKLNLTSFSTPNKMIQVDNNPNSDKYLTKKILMDQNNLYYGTDTGKIFYYDLKNNTCNLFKINENLDNLPLIGTPVKFNDYIYFIDINSNVYKMNTIK